MASGVEESTGTLLGHEAREPKHPIPEGMKLFAADANAAHNYKRKPDNGGFNISEYLKIRAIVKELRPFFMEVLHTHDFREGKAANEIRKGMNTMMELAKHLTRTESALKSNKVPEPLDAAFMMESADIKPELEKPSEQPAPPGIQTVSGTNSGPIEGKKMKPQKKYDTEGSSRGSFVVGGSPVGWNFLVYPGSKLVYYGRTKESVRQARATKK